MTARWRALVTLALVAGLVAGFSSCRRVTPRLEDARVSAGAVVLTFSGRPVAAQSHVSVTGTSGVLVSGAPTASGDTLVLPVGATAPRAVAYHAVFSDGSELAGEADLAGGGAASAAPAHEHGVDPVGAVLLVIDGLATLVVVALLMRRPRRPAPRDHAM